MATSSLPMKVKLVFYLKLLWPICLVDAFLSVALYSPDERLWLWQSFIIVALTWILSYRGSLKTGHVSTGIIAALIYTLIWGLVMNFFISAFQGTNQEQGNIGILVLEGMNIPVLWKALLGYLIFIIFGIFLFSLLSWPAAYLGRKNAIKKGLVLPLSSSEGKKPWWRCFLFLCFRLAVILSTIIFLLVKTQFDEAFGCGFSETSFSECRYRLGDSLFLAYSFILIFFNTVLMCVDVVNRKNFSSSKLIVLDFALAFPSYFFTSLIYAVVCSLPFFARAVMRLADVGNEKISDQ
jgi:hypothetical protein